MTKATRQIKSPNAINVSNIQEYCLHKSIRKAALYSITPEGAFYHHNGEEYTEKEFEEKFHLNLHPKQKHGGNVDRTKNFIHGLKNY